MNQTAVDWLFDQYKLIGMLTTAQVEKAKEIEKKQIAHAYISGGSDFCISGWTPDKEEAEQYYNKTYGGKDEN
jgi:hypothetical protein